MKVAQQSCVATIESSIIFFFLIKNHELTKNCAKSIIVYTAENAEKKVIMDKYSDDRKENRKSVDFTS